ncbi:hypothetical protein AVEN_243963-1 [Araneus ventricosus]|uniref:Uncharacterized protein n=1 Tax=Araneus ventricosus TaxID=182803 RepID=A0A4Y2VMB5_ARAVE|nr:hypothetical protein AVEN_243963-1 [Araneus ventricosus]
MFSRAKSRNRTIWLIPAVHHWYQGSLPGGCLSIGCNRRDHTTLTRFLSGHIRSLTFSDNSKCFEICPKCTAEQATPDSILACLGLSKQDLVSNPVLTLDFFRVHRLMDLTDSADIRGSSTTTTTDLICLECKTNSKLSFWAAYVLH